MGMQTQIEKYTVLSGAGLSLHQCGHEDCAKGHRFGPAVRDHYLLHCIFRGEGRFEAAGRSYSLRAGQGFLIVPGQVTVYAASETSPWLYHWVGFSGGEAPSVLAACGLRPKRRSCPCGIRSGCAAAWRSWNSGMTRGRMCSPSWPGCTAFFPSLRTARRRGRFGQPGA